MDLNFNRGRILLLGVLLGLGAFMRFHALDRQSLWDDEMSTIQTMSTPFPRLLHRFATYETHPPLYFLQLRLWHTLRMSSLVKLRANSALWGSLSLLLIFFVARRYGGEELGFLSAALLALSPFHLAYSQELRPYAMALAISLAGLWALERRAWVALGCFWTTQLYTHYWGAFVVAAQGLYGLWSISSPMERKKLGMAFLTASGLFAFWLPVLWVQLNVINQLVFWVPAFSFANLGKVYLAYTGILFNMASWTFYLPAKVWVLVLVGCLFAAALVKGIQKGPRAALIWLTVGLLIPWLLSAWKASVFVWYRYPVHMLPAFVLLVAAGLLAYRPTIRIALIWVLLGSQAWGDWVYYHGWQKANPKAVVQYIHWLRQPNTIVVRPFYFGELFHFYDNGTTESMDEDVLDSPEKRAALKNRNVVLVAFEVPSDPIADAFLTEYKPLTARYFPGTAHLGVTVYQLSYSKPTK